MNRIKPGFLTASILLLIALTHPCAGSPAFPPSSLVRDMAPVAAHVKAVRYGVLILDAGKRQKVKKGDLFSLFPRSSAPGPPPFCRTTKVGESESVCTVVRGRGPFQEGITAIRFQGMQAAVQTKGAPLSPQAAARELARAIPHVEWDPATVSTVLSPSYAFRLEVRQGNILLFDHEGRPWRRYEMSNAFAGQAGGKAAPPPCTPVLSGAERVGRLPLAARQVLLTSMGAPPREVVVYLMEHAIAVGPYRVQGQPVLMSLPGGDVPLSFSVQESSGNIALNIIRAPGGLVSRILRYHGGLSVVARDINLWLGYRDGTSSDRLYGQTFLPGQLFGDKAFLLHVEDGAVVYEDKVPIHGAGIFLPGGVAADLNGNGVTEEYYPDASGGVKVIEDGAEVARLSGLVIAARPGQAVMAPIARFTAGKANGVLAAKEEAGASRICSLEWRKGELTLVPLTPRIDGEVAGLFQYRGDIYFAVVRSGKGEETVLYRAELSCSDSQ